jgi:hypothetical protein
MAQAVSEKDWLTTKARKYENAKREINLVLYVFRVFVVKK